LKTALAVLCHPIYIAFIVCCDHALVNLVIYAEYPWKM
jgi:hypothetical protein